MVDEMSVTELKTRLDAGEDLLVLDVRNPVEWEISALEGTLRIPKPDIEAAMNEVLGRAQAARGHRAGPNPR